MGKEGIQKEMRIVDKQDGSRWHRQTRWAQTRIPNYYSTLEFEVS